jgi:dipeptidase
MTSIKSAIFLKVWAIIFFAGFTAGARACDTWVALQDATADHSVILCKNSDRPPMEAQPLVQIPHQRHAAGEMVKCTYIEIPQVAETYEHIGSKIWWTFGYEHGMNEYGVAIANEAVTAKEPLESSALIGMDFVRLGLERAKTAYEAMHVIIDLLEQYGQGGKCEHEGEWGTATYNNSFILADTREAWVLETAGKYWVAKRVRNGVYSISNIYSIERDWDEAHPALVQHAMEKGWTKSAKAFNFARDYGDYWGKNSDIASGPQIRHNMTLLCLRKDFAQVTPASMMQLSRSHFEGTIAEPRWGASETFLESPCMHDTAQDAYHTAASMVAHLRAEMPPLLRQVYWASFSNPCCNVFKPFYLHGPTLPLTYAAGTSTYSGDSPWWWANRVKLLCDLNHSALAPAARGVFDRTERWEMEHQATTEAEALRQIKAGKDADAVTLLQQFTNDNCERVGKEYLMLNQILPAALKTVGIEYVFADYMQAWTSKHGVPLP